MTNSAEAIPKFDFEPEDRYARHKLITWWDQEKLHRSKILVIGAGAIGNETLKNLALLGVGHIFIVDFDLIEVSNLSRSVLFSDKDIGRPKSEVAAESIRHINPEIAVDWLYGDVELDLGLNKIREFDIVLGCLDSVNARWAINRACLHANVPWINAGISATAGEVTFFHPTLGGCYECGMTSGMWQRFNQRYSCMLLLKSMPPQTVPTTAIVASLTASIQVNEAVGHLHEVEERLRPGQKLFFSLKPYNMFIVDIPRDSTCPAHEVYEPQTTINASPCEMTVADVLELVPESLSVMLDFDLLASLSCNSCGEEHIFRPVKKIANREITCPKCTAERTPRIINEIMRDDAAASLKFSDLGIPPNCVLKIRTANGSHFLAING